MYEESRAPDPCRVLAIVDFVYIALPATWLHFQSADYAM